MQNEENMMPAAKRIDKHKIRKQIKNKQSQ